MDEQKKSINWNFRDKEINSSTQLINRQKSALNINVESINKLEKSGIFNDKKNGTVKTTLENCECRDFNFVGKAPRKQFMPCMHIYRLASELGLIQLKHIDLKTKLTLMSFEERKRIEVKRLHQFEKDPSQWGEWHEKIHKSKDQRNRQYNAWNLICCDLGKKHSLKEAQTGMIHNYNVTLLTCTCPDFQERKLPCKHIYCLALLKGIKLLVTEEEYQRKNKYLNYR